MNKILRFCLFLPFIGFGQITITDDFTDSNFSANPTWLGIDSVFEVVNQELHLNDNNAGEAYLGINSIISDNASWEFYARMQFNPSTSNFTRVYLMSDNQDLTAPLNGYYVRLGGSSADKLSLYRQDGTTATLITESGDDYLDLSNVEVRVKVSRNSGGIWTLQADTGSFVNPLISLGTGVDSTYRSSTHFGVFCKYTVTRADLFYFDDFTLTGTGFTDTLSPILDSIKLIDNQNLRLYFNEPLDSVSAESSGNYIVDNGLGNPVLADLNSQNGREVDLQFSNRFLNGQSYTINIQNVEDLFGNSSPVTLSFVVNDPVPTLVNISLNGTNVLELIFSEPVTQSSAEDITNYQVDNGIGLPLSAIQNATDPKLINLQFGTNFQERIIYMLTVQGVMDTFGNTVSDSGQFVNFIPADGDVVINELMPDPVPVIGVPPNALPAREYIELYNRSGFPVDLSGWALIIGNTTEPLPTYTLLPDSFVVFTKDEGVNEFPPGLPIVGLDMSTVALTNSGNTVTLLSPAGIIISTVSYTDDWYADVNKDEGGWSLEQVDPDNACGGSDNWRASINPIGGTPGRSNSVLGINPDTTAPAFSRIAILGDSTVLIYFTEKVDLALLADTANYRIYSNTLPQPALVILSAEPQLPQADRVILNFTTAIDANAIYTLYLKTYPTDCGNNGMLPDSLLFAIPAIPVKGEILINEILFNPPTGGADFVEIYNNSDKIFDLSKLRTANVEGPFNELLNIKEITEESYLFEPGRYLVFTTDPGFIDRQFNVVFPENILEVNSLPAMSDGEGSIAIATSQLELVDHFIYTDDYHLSFLKNTEGISLERISFERETNDGNNWTSASSASNYATPGYKNGQNIIPDLSMAISIEPKVFHPDRETVSLGYSFEKLNNVLSVSIWSPTGYKLRDIIENKNVSQQGFVVWDGTDNEGLLQNSGVYIVVFDYYNEDGIHEVLKETCVLSL